MLSTEGKTQNHSGFVTYTGCSLDSSSFILFFVKNITVYFIKLPNSLNLLNEPGCTFPSWFLKRRLHGLVAIFLYLMFKNVTKP